MKDDDILKDAREAFNQCEDNENKTRELFAENIEFSRLGKQWPEKVEERREQEGRPCLTINRMPSFIRQVVNDSRLNKPAIRVRPVDSGADIETAKIIDGLIRHIEAQSDADAAYDTAIDFAVTGGFGYLRVDVDYACDDTFDMDIKIDRVINPLTIYGDPRGQRVDSSDWNLCFETETLSHDEFEKRYKGAEKVDWDGQYRDVKDQAWFTDNSVRVADYWTRDEVDGKILKLSDGTIIDEALFRDQADLFAAMGLTVQGERPSKTYKVRKRIITGAEVLADEDWAGKYIPIIPVYGDEVIVDGHRQFIRCSITPKTRNGCSTSGARRQLNSSHSLRRPRMSGLPGRLTAMRRSGRRQTRYRTPTSSMMVRCRRSVSRSPVLRRVRCRRL